VLNLGTGLAVSGNWHNPNNASADPCGSDGTWLFTGEEYYTLNGNRCWNGSTVWNYDNGQVGCTAVPYPPFINYCVSQASGALAPAWYSGLWANFSAVAALVPVCFMPRIYDWGNGSWNSRWYSHLGFC
jgi:hypothetical protein